MICPKCKYDGDNIVIKDYTGNKIVRKIILCKKCRYTIRGDDGHYGYLRRRAIYSISNSFTRKK